MVGGKAGEHLVLILTSVKRDYHSIKLLLNDYVRHLAVYLVYIS